MLEIFLLFIEFCISDSSQCSDSLSGDIIPASHFFNCDELPSSIYEDGVLKIPPEIKSIGAYAFFGTPITSVVVNSTVENLSSYAFEGCEHLTSITIEQSLGKNEILGFTLVPNLKRLTVNGTTVLEDKNFNAPVGWFDSIPDYYFSGSEFETLSLSASNQKQNDWKLGKGSFSNCLNLKEIKINSQILDLPSNTFYNCPSLSKIMIGSNHILQNQNAFFTSIDKIGSSAFSASTPIKTVYFGNRNYTLGGNIIESSSLGQIKFLDKPIGMQFIDGPPFEGCLNLKPVEFSIEDYNCETFDTVNFTIFAQGTSLQPQEGWCGPRSNEDSGMRCNFNRGLLALCFLLLLL